MMRRVAGIVALALSSASLAQQIDLGSGSIVQTVQSLKAGQYVWAPQAAPDGPMLMLVNLQTQRALLFRNGVPIGASTVSTGKAGHDTPTGVFTILQKQVEHYSSKYNNAPMPYMQRLTWGGVALHAGNLPGYPASHGCIRLPSGFAKLLYGATSLGMTVVISNAAVTPRVAPGPNLLSSSADESLSPEGYDWHPEKSAGGPISIVVSSADKRAIVLRNGIPIGSAEVSVDGSVSGTWAYALRNIDMSGRHWMRVSLTQGSAASEAVPTQEWNRFHAPEAFRQAVAAIVQPGTTVVVTSDSLRSGAVATPLTVIDAESKSKD